MPVVRDFRCGWIEIPALCGAVTPAAEPEPDRSLAETFRRLAHPRMADCELLAGLPALPATGNQPALRWLNETLSQLTTVEYLVSDLSCLECELSTEYSHLLLMAQSARA